FQECNANLSTYGYADMKQVAFHDCSLRGTDFYETKLNKVSFHNTDLNEANFEGAPLNGIDLSTCTFDELNVSHDLLKGCTVSPEQAIGFARLLGLVIKDE
ncbi:MAG: pentapeptide repeat-containing protein, partial [Bacillota bacterium]|nr:pentapeptide repeat-containing protein [Bacillota bacterium]